MYQVATPIALLACLQFVIPKTLIYNCQLPFTIPSNAVKIDGRLTKSAPCWVNLDPRAAIILEFKRLVKRNK